MWRRLGEEGEGGLLVDKRTIPHRAETGGTKGPGWPTAVCRRCCGVLLVGGGGRADAVFSSRR